MRPAVHGCMDLRVAAVSVIALWGVLLVLDGLRAAAADGTTAMIAASLALLPPIVMAAVLLGRRMHRDRLVRHSVQ